MAYGGWTRKSWFVCVVIASVGGWIPLTSVNSAFAQISSDSTLGTSISPNTVIRGILSNQVNGGTIRGVNLFHSFREFNVGEGRGIYFSNPAGVQNIINRVTGGSRSDILGTLGVLGNANLFLLNPNGIFFGPNARLDLNGSFIGSTASSLTFQDGSQFNTTDTTPTLTISTPLGLQFGQTAAEIRSQGAILGVQPNQTLALIGGSLIVEGGVLFADGGRIELGSVSGGSLVGITPASNGLALDYSNVQGFQDIQLSQQARIQAGEPFGTITIQSGRFIAQGDSDVSVTTSGSGNAGTLTLRAAESVELSGASTLFGQVASTAQGRGGDITVETKRLSLRDGSQITSSTFGVGDAGTLRIRASESVELVGNGTALFASVRENATGLGGDINLETNRLTLREGAFISATTSGFGKAGNINVQALDLVDLIGRKPPDPDTLAIPKAATTTTVTRTFTVNGITRTIITTRFLQETQTALNNAAIRGSQGDAGNINIKTKQFRLQDDAFVTTSNAGQGNAGNQVIIASDSANLGYGGLYSEILQGSQGNGGNIIIQTGTLDLRRGSEVSVSNLGSGRGGSLEITAKDVFLGNRAVQPEDSFQVGKKRFIFPSNGRLTATSASGNGGNIALHLQNILLMVGSSTISAEAGTASAGGDGGNIMISGRFVLTNRGERNRITANAFKGRGGNIQIQASEGILGFAPIDPSSNSSITASSKLGLSGTVSVRAPFFDFSRQLTELPQEAIDISNLIASSCPGSGSQVSSRYTVKIHRELPSDPVEVLGSEPQTSTITEAQGWFRDPKNPAVLRMKPESQTFIPWLVSTPCHAH